MARPAQHRDAFAAQHLGTISVGRRNVPILQPLGQAQHRRGLRSSVGGDALQRRTQVHRRNGRDQQVGASTASRMSVVSNTLAGIGTPGSRRTFSRRACQSACFRAGAPEGDAMLGILGQDHGDGGAPCAGTQDRKSCRHGHLLSSALEFAYLPQAL